jgi:hypothetical protein
MYSFNIFKQSYFVIVSASVAWKIIFERPNFDFFRERVFLVQEQNESGAVKPDGKVQKTK